LSGPLLHPSASASLRRDLASRVEAEGEDGPMEERESARLETSANLKTEVKTKASKLNPSKTMLSKSQKISRRRAVTRAGGLVGAALASRARPASAAESRSATEQPRGGFLLCLNMATIRGQKLGIVKEVEVAAKAGYQAIEPWVSSIEAYQKEGGSLPDLKKR